MGKFLVECPDCGSYVELGTGLFDKKKVTCVCGKVLTTKEHQFASKVCPHCGNKMDVKERVENLPEVILYKEPKLIAVFKRCFRCRFFFAKWFIRKENNR